MSHSILEDEVGSTIKTEEVSLLSTQTHRAVDDGLVVVGIIVVAAGGVIHQERFAELTVGAILEHRSEAGALGGKKPFAFMAGSSCFFCGSSFGAFGQPFELSLIGYKTLARVGLCYYVLTKLQRKAGKLFVDLFEALFGSRIEVGAILSELTINHLRKTELLRCQVGFHAGVIHSFDALEEAFVEKDIIRYFGHHRADFFSKLIHFIIALGLEQVVEHTFYALQQKTRAVKSGYRVLESGSIGAVNDSVNLGIVLCNCSLKSGLVIRELYLAELYYAILILRRCKQRVLTCGAG